MNAIALLLLRLRWNKPNLRKALSHINKLKAVAIWRHRRICTCPRPYSCRSTRPLMSLERMQIQFCYFIFIDWSPGMYSAWLQFSYLFADSSFSFSWVFNAPLAWISSLREPTKFFRSSRKRFAPVAGARHEVGRGRRHYSGPIKITRERAGAVRGHWANCY